MRSELSDLPEADLPSSHPIRYLSAIGQLAALLSIQNWDFCINRHQPIKQALVLPELCSWPTDQIPMRLRPISHWPTCLAIIHQHFNLSALNQPCRVFSLSNYTRIIYYWATCGALVRSELILIGHWPLSCSGAWRPSPCRSSCPGWRCSRSSSERCFSTSENRLNP